MCFEVKISINLEGSFKATLCDSNSLLNWKKCGEVLTLGGSRFDFDFCKLSFEIDWLNIPKFDELESFEIESGISLK